MEYSNSLVDFYNSIIKKNIDDLKKLNVLEIGCGNYSFLETIQNNFEITAIDLSVDKILSAPNSKINYISADVFDFLSNSIENGNEKYDLIIDSHLLHCIVDLEQRDKLFKLIYQNLKVGGIFASETMVKKSSSESYFLFKERIILSSFEIEEEFIRSGLKILNLIVSPDLYFLDDITRELKCDLLRITGKK
jgi:2-polyprenyl-3-methyl-5-hydroxy-6-metoxy-1,4-benzoquinol methylase